MNWQDPAQKSRHEPGTFLTTQLQDQPIWVELLESIRDRFFPPKLPPLELTSTPIPVPDRMATNTNPWAVGTATLVNGGVLALVLLLGMRTIIQADPKARTGPKFDLKDFTLFTPKADGAHGGQGGGTNDLIDANKGRLPKLEVNPMEPVQVPLLDHPKLAIDNAIALQPDIRLPDNPSMPMIGVHNSANVTLISGGPGSRGGIGTGPDGGYGPGSGPGWGPGSGPGIYRPGVGGVSQPIPISTPEAEFSDEARRVKYQGVCLISVIVDAQGNPQNPRVVRPLGMGLDEKALEAVRKYRFKPAKKDGKAVAVWISVEVNFRLY